jgi:hypothetical protein
VRETVLLMCSALAVRAALGLYAGRTLNTLEHPQQRGPSPDAHPIEQAASLANGEAQSLAPEAYETAAASDRCFREAGDRPPLPSRRQGRTGRQVGASSELSPAGQWLGADAARSSSGLGDHPSAAGLRGKRAEPAAGGQRLGVVADAEQAAGELLGAVEEVIERS